jgi:predicted patatin/cPLA2 family phospholipase
MNTQRAYLLAELVLKYQELVLVYQQRERDYAMYSHRIAKIFKKLAAKAAPEDAAFAGRCISPAVDISMDQYTQSQTDANAKIDEIGVLLDQLQNTELEQEQTIAERFMKALRHGIPPLWKL